MFVILTIVIYKCFRNSVVSVKEVYFYISVFLV